MIDLFEAMNGSPSQIALKMWADRFALEVGMVSSVKTKFTIEVHRLSESEFLVVLEDVPRQEKYTILDTIHETKE